MAEFAGMLKEALRELHISQVELSKRTGISNKQISMYVHGHVIPYDKRRKQIAIALGKPEDYFQGCEQKRPGRPRKTQKKLIGTGGCKWGQWGGIGGRYPV